MQWYFPTKFILQKKNSENSNHIEKRAGTHQIPILQTPENWMIADSTPLLHLLDSRLPARKFYPPGLIGLLSAVVEEYFDEWIPRLAIWSRWASDEETAVDASEKMAMLMMGKSMPAVAQNMQQWGKRAVRAVGMSSIHQQEEGEKELLRLFSSLDTQLQNAQLTKTGNETKRFIFGQVPTAADCVVYGCCSAHFMRDLYPRRVLQHLTTWHAALKSVHDPVLSSVSIERMKPNDSLPPFVEL